MADVPDDVWACCYYTAQLVPAAGWTNAVSINSHVLAFLIRAGTHAEAQAKADEFAEETCRRMGLGKPYVCVNNVPGGRALVDLENETCRVTSDRRSRRYELETAPPRARP